MDYVIRWAYDMLNSEKRIPNYGYMSYNREGGIYYLSWQVSNSGWLHYDSARAWQVALS